MSSGVDKKARGGHCSGMREREGTRIDAKVFGLESKVVLLEQSQATQKMVIGELRKEIATKDAQITALADALMALQNGNGVRAAAEYVRWLASRHQIDGDENEGHSARLDVVAEAMDAAARALVSTGHA